MVKSKIPSMCELQFKIKDDFDLKSNDTVIVAVSGGPDSMLLLDICNSQKEIVLDMYGKKKMKLNFICAHVNHNTGRKGQLEEQKFVEDYCKKNNIKFELLTIKEYEEDNFHNEARKKRYEFFESLVKKYDAKYLFTAHHADDLVETILMRITRGSTLKGYAGFSKIVDKGTYKIGRPLIEMPKEEILRYLEANNIPYMIDSSNEKDNYTRNRFRKYIVPEFKKEDNYIHHKFYKFSKTLLECNNYIDKIALKKLNSLFIDSKLDIKKFLKEEKIIQTKVLYSILEQIYKNDINLITDRHIEILHEIISSKKANTMINFPNKVQIIKEYDILKINLGNIEIEKDYKIKVDDNIRFNGYINLPNGRNIEWIPEECDNSNFICRLNGGEIKMPLYVRTRKDGDKIQIKNMIGIKKLNDIFIDSKIPLCERNQWPVVVDSDDKIVWLPGLKKTKFDKTKDDLYDIILKYY